MRPPKACLQCRNGKRRCDRDGDSACVQCMQRNLSCSAARGCAAAGLRRPAVSQPLFVGSPTVLDEADHHLVDLYFRYIHNQPHSIFHEPTFRASLIDGTVSLTVLYSMLGLSARFAAEPDLRRRGPMYAAKATAALKADLEHICIENIQACILVGNTCRGDDENADAESLYFALANRMAQIMNLGVTSDADDGVTRELKKRIWWTCFITDTWASGGSNLSRQFRWQTIRPRVPMDEYVFNGMVRGDPDISDAAWKIGLWGHVVRIVEIYMQIQDLHRYLAEMAEWNEDQMDEAVRGLDAELAAFSRGLDPELHFSLENLAIFVARGLGSVFIAFHLGYHHYYVILFYVYLDQRRPSTTNGRAYSDRCKAHAKIICDVLKASREHPQAKALYNIVGHVTIVSSSVLLHTYLFGETHELADAKARLESNFESLVELRRYWPSVEQMINRLVIFQDICIRSLGRNTYRFDKWMVKFLIAHALDMEDKDKDELASQQSPPAAGMDHTTGMSHLERGRITKNMIMDMQNS